MEKTITVSEYVNHFGFIVLSGYSALHTREISTYGINRPGLELTGFFEATAKNRLVNISHKEIKYINDCQDKETLIKAYDFLTNDECPAIVISGNCDCPEDLLRIAKEKNFPVLMTAMHSIDLSYNTLLYLQKELAPSTSMHASLVEIYSMGVLIMGESGIGKSETTLDLVKKGHRLVADDRVNLSLVGDRLVGEAPEITYGIMESRGIGIIDIGRMFGINALLRRKSVYCVINLIHYDANHNYDRLGNSTKYMDILGYKVPMLTIPVSGGRSISDLIECAVTNLKLKERGIDSTYEFEKRMDEMLLKDKGRDYEY